jgi:hypothetical protein
VNPVENGVSDTGLLALFYLLQNQIGSQIFSKASFLSCPNAFIGHPVRDRSEIPAKSMRE